MFIRKSLAVATSVVALAGLAACDSTNRSAENTTETRTETSQQDQIKKEEVVGIQTDELNKNEIHKGEGEVRVQKEVTRSITSEESVPTVVEGERKLDINRMEADDFVAIGLSREVAKNIVEYRDKQNGFKSIDELNQVPGMNASMFGNLRNKLGLSPARQ